MNRIPKWMRVLRDLRETRPDLIEEIEKGGISIAEFQRQVSIGKNSALKIFSKVRDGHGGLTDEVLHLLKQRQRQHVPITVAELSDILDVGISRVISSLDKLKDTTAYNVVVEENAVFLSKEIQKREPTRISVDGLSVNYHKFGLISDNHLASRYARLDVLNALYEHFENEGVEIVFNAGNFVDGDARFNRHDLVAHGVEAQLDYFLQHYPSNLQTYFITGDDHEGWWTQREGIDVGSHLMYKAGQVGRDDLHYLGHMEHDVLIPAKNGATVIRVQHPGGGSSYAVSYAPQKIVESLQGGEKPHILLLGHYHKASYNLIRGVHVIQAGCTEDQTPFMRKKKLGAHLGGWIFEFWTDDNGAITRFRSEFTPFYNRDYYSTEKNWSYQWDATKTIG